MNTEIESISTRLNKLIEEAVQQRLPANPLEYGVEELKWRYDEMLNNARDLLEDFRAEGLTYSGLEAEGYLRGVLTAKNLFDETFE